MSALSKIALVVVGLAFVATVGGFVSGHAMIWQASAVILTVAFAMALRGISSLRGYQFTAWIVAAVTVAMIYPWAFVSWGGVELRNPWVMLLVIQLVMFGMGTQMSLHDFTGVAKNPRGVLVGIICHFSIMPLVGFALTKLFSFPPEIAAGIILIGSCSSGLASNVMAFIARSNLGLSVTVTAITTLGAPLLTPLLMKLLAGELVPVDFFKMMTEIIKHVVVPIGAALLHDYLKTASPRGWRVTLAVAALAAAWLVFLVFGGWAWLGDHFSGHKLATLGLVGFFLAAVVAGLAYHVLVFRVTRIERWMPVASMAGIIYFTTVTTAKGRDDLLKVGGLLFLAAAIHNAAGYFFGYTLSRVSGLDKNSARSVAFEVGLQNGGMATGIASAMGKIGTVGLASAIFSPWMNVSGSLLANYWKRHPVEPVDRSGNSS
jgi:BASS family bile acid:Na+ symporter